MTIPYDADDRNCTECRETVEDYIGHLHASEVTLCEECYEEHAERWQHRVEVVHSVPKR